MVALEIEKKQNLKILLCPNTESNSGPSLYERDALPAELFGQKIEEKI